MKPRNINNSLPLQPLVPDQENKNKKSEEKSEDSTYKGGRNRDS